ncbi:Fc.00g038410.m01.CDS01 [Cosmosporella sp. VM-42]
MEKSDKSQDINDNPAEMHRTASDIEGEVQAPNHLHRDFKERHVSMIAVAGAIGTGLIIGSGTGLVRGGPASLLIAYAIIGAVVYFVMTAIREMATMLPSDKGFAGYATRFVDPALGYATGWNYFLKYAIVLPNNLTAAGIIIQYCRPDLNVAIFIVTFTVAIVAINVSQLIIPFQWVANHPEILHVSFFGEVEFWLPTVKLLVSIILVLTCFIISLGGQPSGERIGFGFWNNPGAFGEYLVEGSTGRFLGFWACVAFGEAPNPRKTVPRAIRQTLWRITFFYIIGVLVLGMAVPYTNDRLIGATTASTGAAASPFVVAVQLAGIPVFPHVINGCLLIFVLSAANSDIYIGSRTLFGLASDGQAPSIFKKTTGKGVPLAGVVLTSLFTALAYMNVSKSSSTVFGYLVSFVTAFGTLNWISYSAFVPKFKITTFVTSYIGILVYLSNIFSYKIWKKTSKVELHSIDLDTGRMEDNGEKYVSSIARLATWTVSWVRGQRGLIS